MGDGPQLGFKEAPLDSEILSTPYRVQTNWHVITGAPCCGKTTLIDQLASMGYQTVPETSRQYIEAETAKGRTIEEIFESKADAYAIRDWQICIERELCANDFLILDRALPDCLAFWPFYDLDPNEFLAQCFDHHYASVFTLDRLPLELDGARVDDDPMNDYLDHCHARDYAALGYDVIRVPILPPKERLAFILETLSEYGVV